MAENRYAYPVPLGTLDNRTLTRLAQLPVRVSCSVGLLSDPCCGFNMVHCREDSDYFQPLCIAPTAEEAADCGACQTASAGGCTATDLLYFQFKAPDNFNDWGNADPTHRWSADKIGDWLAWVDVYSECPCGLKFSDYVVDHWVGAMKDGRRYQNILIDPTKLPPEFFLRFDFNLGGDGILSAYSEPYRRITCESTFQIEGQYPTAGPASVDCSSYYYGDPDYSDSVAPFRFRRITRVLGSLEPAAFDIEREDVTSSLGVVRTVKTTLVNKWRLRTARVPFYVVETMRDCLMAERLLVDARQLRYKGETAKNMDFGTMWVFDAMLEEQLACAQKNFTCE